MSTSTAVNTPSRPATGSATDERGELRRIVAGRPTPACLRRGSVAGTVVVDEGGHPHDREAGELGSEHVVGEPRVREHAGWMAVDEQIGASEPRAELVAVGPDPEVEAVPLLARGEAVVQRERIGPAGMLDPDDPRPEVGEHAPDERGRPRGAEHDHGGSAHLGARDVGHAIGDRRLAAHRDRRHHPGRRFGVDRARRQPGEVGEAGARRRRRRAERHRQVGERGPRRGRTGVDPAVGGAQEHGALGPGASLHGTFVEVGTDPRLVGQRSPEPCGQRRERATGDGGTGACA